MKIGEYEQMMAYLTRPGFSGGSGKKPITIKELKDSGKIVTGDKYTPSNPKLIQAIRRFEEKFPRKKNDIGGRQIAERPDGPKIAEQPGGAKIAEPPKSMQMDTTTSNPIPEYDINDFRNDAEIYVLMLHNNTIPKGDIADKLNSFAQKGIDAGTFSMQDAGDMVRRLIGEVKDRARYQRLRDVIPEGIGTVEREDFSAGGAAEIRKYLKGLKTNSTVDISKYLKKHDLTGNKRTAASATFKRVLDEFDNKNFKIITAEDAYDKFVPLNKDEVKIAKEVYKDEIKNYDSFDDWQRDTKNKYKVSDIRTKQTTLETKPTGIIKDDPDRIRTVAKRGQENISDVIFPDKKMPSGKTMEQEFLDDLDIKFSTPRGQGLQNADFVKKYPISDKQVQRVINFYIKKKGLKYPKGETTGSYKQKKEKYGPVTDLTTEETISKKLKQPILREKNLVKKTGKVTKGVIDFAHRISKEHANALGIQFGTENTGFDSRLINQIIVRPSEIRLEKFYERQRNILDKIKSKGATKELVEEMNNINGLINKEVKKTSGRLIGVNIDPNTQEISFTGQNRKFKFSNLNKTFQEIKNIPYEERIELLRKDVAKGVDAEIKRGFRPYDFRLILGDPKNRKTLLKYAKENAPDIFSKFKKILDNPESRRRFAIYSKLPTVALPAGIVLSLAGQSGDAMAAETGQKEEFDPEKTDPTLTTALGAAGAYKYGPQLLKILKNVGRGTIKTLGSLPAALTYAGFETKAGMDEGKNFADAVTEPMVGLNLLLPETVKKLGPLMAKGARISTPVGTAITGIGTLKNRAQDMIRTAEELAALQATPYQQNLIDEYAAADYRGYELGGRVGFADGPEDPSKRKFMKIMGGLASLPIVGRFFDIGEKAAPVVKNIFTKIEKLKNTKTLMPDWFPAFVDKFRKEGKAENMFKKKRIEVTEQEYYQAVAEGKAKDYFVDPRTPEYKAKNPDHMTYYKVEDTDELIGTTYTNDKFPGVNIDDFDGEVRVNWENDYSQPVDMVYVKPGKTGPDLDRVDKFQAGIEKQELKPQGEFSAMDQEVYATDPDGGYDTEAVIVDSVDDMMEGTTRQMEEYATGKKVKNLSRGEGKVIEAEVRANQMAEEVGGADYEGDPINLMDDRDYGDAGFDD